MAVDKLVDSAQLDADLTTVANAIRTKGGTSAQMAFPAGFVSAIQAIPTGGGGASNVVTGTFKGTTAGSTLDVTLNYSGTGYPIAALIFPTEGPRASGSFANLVQRYAISLFCAVKQGVLSAPTYETMVGANTMLVLHSYKSSTSNAISYSNSGVANAYILIDEAAASGSGTYVKIRSAKKMSVFIASTSYGFAANIEYTYYVIYSS